MSMKYIRKHYGVPAKRGGLVEFTDTRGRKWLCEIRSTRDAYLRVSIPGIRKRVLLHPTWNIRYLEHNVGAFSFEQNAPKTRLTNNDEPAN
jgi:hypothetical protein